MKAIILAGGDGKRLRPITCTMPKPMVPVLDKPVLFHTLELLKKHGILDVVITLGYMGDSIKKAVGDGGRWGLHVSYSDPEKRLGTAGSVRFAVDEDEGEVLVLSGDGITDIDLSDLISAHRKSSSAVTAALYRVLEPSEYGIAITDGEGYIKRFIEKPSEGEVFSDRANTGIYVLSEEALRAVPKNEEYDFSKQLFPKLLDSGKKLFGYEMKGYWCDIGDASELRRACADLLDGNSSFSTGAERIGGSFVEKGAVISGDAVVMPPCYIGKNAEIAAHAVIEPYSVIGSGARIMEGASVKRSIVMSGAVVRRYAELRGAIVCEKAEIDSRATLLEGSIIGAGSFIGKRALVAQSISIWPDKNVPQGERCIKNVIWGENGFSAGEGSCFKGYADRDLTPELSLRIAACFASLYDKPFDMGVGSDGSAASVMIKQAVISGVLSQGADVISSEAVSRSAFGHMIRNSGLKGGIYVESEEFERRVSLRIYSGFGVEADGALMRSIIKKLGSDEVRPTTSSEIGVIRSTGSAGLQYEASLERLSELEGVRGFPGKLIINAKPTVSDTVARIFLKSGWTVDTVSELRRLIPTHNADAVSVLVTGDERISFYTAALGAVDRNRLLAAIAVTRKIPRAVMPTELGEELREYLENNGVDVVYAPEDPARRRCIAREREAYDPRLLEPEAIVTELGAMFARGVLTEAVKALPVCVRRDADVGVSKCDFGRMLRSVIENEYDRVSDMVDGVKLRFDSGWVTVRPIAERSAFRVVAGSRDAEYSKELCDVYAQKLRKLKLTDNRS